MKQKVRILLSFFVIACMPAFAFIYESKVMRIWNPEQQQYHYFIGCSDFHDHTHPRTESHRATIEKMLAQYPDKSSLKVIVEDLSAPAYNGRFSCGRFFLGPKGGILSGLAQFCKNKGLDVDNVEYRFCRVVALGPVMDQIRNNQTLANNQLPSTCDTRVSMLHQEVDALISEIRSFDDGATLNNFYNKCTQHVEDRCKEIHLTNQSQISAADYIASHTTDTHRVGQINYLLTFDSGLVDAHLIHKVITAKYKKVVVAFAGGAHITAVCSLLANVGYETIYESKSEHVQEYTAAGPGLLQGGNGSYFMRPTPISLDFLNNYL